MRALLSLLFLAAAASFSLLFHRDEGDIEMTVADAAHEQTRTHCEKLIWRAGEQGPVVIRFLELSSRVVVDGKSIAETMEKLDIRVHSQSKQEACQVLAESATAQWTNKQLEAYNCKGSLVDASNLETADFSKPKTSLIADRINANLNNNEVLIDGHVHIEQGLQVLKVNQVTITGTAPNRTLQLEGNLRIRNPRGATGFEQQYLFAKGATYSESDDVLTIHKNDEPEAKFRIVLYDKARKSYLECGRFVINSWRSGTTEILISDNVHSTVVPKDFLDDFNKDKDLP